MNTVVIDLSDDTDPRRDPAFPMSAAHIQALPFNSILELLTAEYVRDTDFEKGNMARARRFAWMLFIKAEINAVKMIYDNGVFAQYGRVPELALGVLMDMAQTQPLTSQIIDDAVWQKLQKPK